MKIRKIVNLDLSSFIRKPISKGRIMYRISMLILGVSLLLFGFYILFSIKPDTDYVIVVERVKLSSILVSFGGFFLIIYIFVRR